jgi:hypothetical protein
VATGPAAGPAITFSAARLHVVRPFAFVTGGARIRDGAVRPAVERPALNAREKVRYRVERITVMFDGR